MSLALRFAVAGAIVWDIAVGGYRQPMAVMDWVWPISALYLGILAAWFYVRRGRRGTAK